MLVRDLSLQGRTDVLGEEDHVALPLAPGGERLEDRPHVGDRDVLLDEALQHLRDALDGRRAQHLLQELAVGLLVRLQQEPGLLNAEEVARPGAQETLDRGENLAVPAVRLDAGGAHLRESGGREDKPLAVARPERRPLLRLH